MREWLAGRLPAFWSGVREVWVAVWAWLTRNVAELVAVAGAYLVAEGVGAIYAPAGLVVGGALLILGAVALKRSAGV